MGVGGGRSLKSKQKRTGEGVSSLSLCSLCKKSCLIFQTANRVLSETYFERGWGNSLKQTYVEEGEDTCKMSKEDWVKNWKF